MNVQAFVGGSQPIGLDAASFLLLKQEGAFPEQYRVELLDGVVWGNPKDPGSDDEPKSDAKYPVKLTVQNYLRLATFGAYERYGKTELIDGTVYAMSPQHRPHGFAKDELAYRLHQALEAISSNLSVATETSVELSPTSEPMPDIALTSEPRGPGAIPASSVALVVEVADTTIDFDLHRKAPLYARAGIAEYWVADVGGRVIHQHWSAGPEGYGDRRKVALDEPVRAATIAELGIETAGM